MKIYLICQTNQQLKHLYNELLSVAFFAHLIVRYNAVIVIRTHSLFLKMPLLYEKDLYFEFRSEKKKIK